MFPLSHLGRQSRTYCPRIDELEDRLCPSTSHLTLNATVLAGHMVQFSGTVTGDHVANFAIAISGAASGFAVSDSAGNFSCTSMMATLGTVSANGYNMFHSTDTAYATITKSPPALSMSVAYGANRTVTVSGQVTDVDVAWRPIALSGVVNALTFTDMTGHFSVTTPASGLGAITATETDMWGLVSNLANVSVSNSAAAILNFESEHLYDNVWKFYGTVADESPAGLMVRFGGLACLGNCSATVQANGTFEITVTLQGGDAGGTATAIVTDWWGVDSDEATTTLS